MADLKDKLVENAAKPAEVTIDGQTVKQHSLPDQIEAAKFQAGKAAVKKPCRGLRFVRISPPGGV